jgi:hypothetical protein
MRKAALLATAIFALPLAALAQHHGHGSHGAPAAQGPGATITQGSLRIETAWARATIGQSRISAAYMIIHNTGATPDRVVAASSPLAGAVELHTHVMENNVARMRRIEAIEVTPGSPTVLAPGGLHIMLIDLRRPLAAGETLPLTLELASGVRVELALPVRGLRPGAQPDR